MRFRSVRENAGVVAAAFVCTIAAVGVAAAVLIGFRNTQGLVLSSGVLASGFGLALLVLVFGRKSSALEQSVWSFFHRREKDPAADYVPKKQRTRRVEYGTHAPPTIEELNELKENVNTWVPSGNMKSRRRK
jgi:hypothetical protein